MVDSVLEVQNIKTTGVSPQKDIVTTSGTGDVTVNGNIVVPDSGTIGSASDTDAITIDSSGKVGIGTASPSSTLDVSGNIIGGNIGIGSLIGGVPLGVIGNATWCAVFRNSANADKHLFYASGTYSNSTGTVGTISDERLKENITDAAPKLSDIMKLRVVNYNLIGDQHKQLGFLAQEFEQVFPSLVFETDTRQLDEDGNNIRGLVDQKIVKVGLDFAILTKAIQEQQALIESQQSQIDALTARIEVLENAAG